MISSKIKDNSRCTFLSHISDMWGQKQEQISCVMKISSHHSHIWRPGELHIDENYVRCLDLVRLTWPRNNDFSGEPGFYQPCSNIYMYRVVIVGISKDERKKRFGFSSETNSRFSVKEFPQKIRHVWGDRQAQQNPDSWESRIFMVNEPQ